MSSVATPRWASPRWSPAAMYLAQHGISITEIASVLKVSGGRVSHMLRGYQPANEKLFEAVAVLASAQVATELRSLLTAEDSNG